MGTFSQTDSEQRAMDQDSGRQEDAHAARRAAKLLPTLYDPNTCPDCGAPAHANVCEEVRSREAENARLRALLARALSSVIYANEIELEEDIRAALAAKKEEQKCACGKGELYVTHVAPHEAGYHPFAPSAALADGAK